MIQFSVSLIACSICVRLSAFSDPNFPVESDEWGALCAIWLILKINLTTTRAAQVGRQHASRENREAGPFPPFSILRCPVFMPTPEAHWDTVPMIYLMIMLPEHISLVTWSLERLLRAPCGRRSGARETPRDRRARKVWVWEMKIRFDFDFLSLVDSATCICDVVLAFLSSANRNSSCLVAGNFVKQVSRPSDVNKNSYINKYMYHRHIYVLSIKTHLFYNTSQCGQHMDQTVNIYKI